LKACPGLATPAARTRPRCSGRPDSAFREVNGVGFRNHSSISELIHTARFLAVYASPHQSPGEVQDSLPACPLRLWSGWTLTSWIPSKGFTRSCRAPPLPDFAWRDNVHTDTRTRRRSGIGVTLLGSSTVFL
jgi:hypothetical protein